MEEKENDGISLLDIFHVFWKNIILVSIITIAITVLGAFYTFGVAKEKYSSSTKIAVSVESSAYKDGTVDYANTLRVMETFTELVETDIVLQPVSDSTGYSISQLKSMIATTNSDSSYVITIKVTSTNKDVTQQIANEVALSLSNVCKTDEGMKNFKASITQIDFPRPGAYASPNKKMYLIISFMGGLIFSSLVVFIKEFMSTKFISKEEVEAYTNELVIGLQYDNKKKKEDNQKKIDLIEPSIQAFEPYNKLLSNIKYTCIDNPSKVILCTSTLMDELKSTTSANLAYCMANNGKKVIILDLDIRKPVLHKTFNVSKEHGLVDLFEGGLNKEDIIKHTKEGVDLITVGKEILNPIVLIESTKLKDLIDELKNEYDYIIIDSPPVLACTDSIVLSKLCDGVVYNIALTSTKKKQVKEGLTQLKNVGAKIIGINLTKVRSDKVERYYYYYNNNKKNSLSSNDK